MIVNNLLNKYLNYKTKYFETVSEFLCTNYAVNNLYTNIFYCNIRSLNANIYFFL